LELLRLGEVENIIAHVHRQHIAEAGELIFQQVHLISQLLVLRVIERGAQKVTLQMCSREGYVEKDVYNRAGNDTLFVI